MKNSIAGVIGFVVGCAVGACAARRYFLAELERTLAEETAKIREQRAKERRAKATQTLNTSEKSKKEIDNYSEIIDEYYSEMVRSPDRPYVISPDEFGEEYEYETISLTYYADGVLADDNDDVIKDDEIEKTVGRDSLDHFGEYEDDSVFVRNESRKCDFEILLDLRTYAEATKYKPRLPEEDQ